MHRIISLFSVLLLCQCVVAQSITSVSGRADEYVGKEVTIYYWKDYLSKIKVPMASGVVEKDSTFHLSFTNPTIRKVFVQVGSNHFYIYASPNASYSLWVTKESVYMDGDANETEVIFYFSDLDTNDINYKILSFDQLKLDFLQSNLSRETRSNFEFAKALKDFKTQLTAKIQTDTNVYFKTYVRYTMASLDNLPFKGARGTYDKYNFYLKDQPIRYQNDRYMEYFLKFYDNFTFQLPNTIIDTLVYGIQQGSPTIMMNTLGNYRLLSDVRIRELVLIDMMTDIYPREGFRKDGVIQILDSLSRFAIVPQHKAIAENIKFRLLDIVPGSEMPEIELTINGNAKTLEDFRGRHLYLQFVTMENENSLFDINLLKPVFEDYGKHVQFVTVLVTSEDHPLEDVNRFKRKHDMAWDLAIVKDDDPILKRLNVSKYPYYILVDATSNVVAAPALTPRPNNEYRTISFILAKIARYYKSMEQNPSIGY